MFGYRQAIIPHTLKNRKKCIVYHALRQLQKAIGRKPRVNISYRMRTAAAMMQARMVLRTQGCGIAIFIIEQIVFYV